MILEPVEVTCPWCGNVFSSSVDPSAGDTQTYVEDCQCCCQPVVFTLHLDDQGAIAELRVQRENE